MPMPQAEIETLLKEAFPDAEITLSDFAGHGDDDHIRARIVSAAFAGKTRIQQHQMVYAALKGAVGGRLHALQLETVTPDRA